MGTFVESSFEASDRTPLWVRQWMPEGEPCSVIFVAHGGADHGGRFAHLAKRWSSQGALVVAHDHRGQGRSGGPPGHVDSFAQYWNDLNELQAKIRQEAKVEHLPWFLFGHSMGGLVTLGYLCEFQSSASSLPRGAIVSAPLLGLAMKVNPLKELLGRIMLRIAPTFAVDPKLPAEYLCRDAAVVEDYRSDPKRTRVVSAGWARAMDLAMARVHRQVSSVTTPLFWYAGDADKICDIEQSRRAFATLKAPTGNDQTFESFPGYFHELHNEPHDLREPVLVKIDNWMATRL